MTSLPFRRLWTSLCSSSSRLLQRPVCVVVALRQHNAVCCNVRLRLRRQLRRRREGNSLANIRLRRRHNITVHQAQSAVRTPG